MARRIREILNGELTDPLTLNVLIYTCTYVLSILSCVPPYVGRFASESFDFNAFIKVITDCIVPTTATLVFSNVIQNFVIASQHRIKRFALSFWALLAVIAYMLIYPMFGECDSLLFCAGVWIVSGLIVVLGMHAIVQIEKEQNRNMKGLSG